MSGPTPSGYSIEPIETPRGKRLYRVTDADMRVIEVPSVTTILSMQDKPGLPWWGMKVGVEGMLKMLEDDIIGHYDVTVDECVAKMTEHKLTVNHTLASAGDRGTRVHDAFEDWCRTGTLPPGVAGDDPDIGYLRGLRSALEAIQSYVVVDQVEIHVASVDGFAGRRGFAGRTDAIFTVDEGCPVMMPGRYIVDLKTSSGIYTSHFRQLAAYQYAAHESGYGRSDGGYVLWVGKDGKWKLKLSPAVFTADFLPVLMLYESEQHLKGLVK